MDEKKVTLIGDTIGTIISITSNPDQAKAQAAAIAAQYPNVEPAEVQSEVQRLDILAIEWVNRLTIHGRGKSF